jgi:hypothetical protein
MMADSKSLVNRMIRAARLDVNLYEEVEAEPGAINQAVLVVVIVSVLSGIGTGISGMMAGGILSFLWGLLAGIAGSLVGWLAWAFFTWLIGTKLLKGPQTSATWTEMLRTIGFAYSPGALRLFAFIPFIGGIIAFAALIWSLVAGVIAVRQALDFSTGRAIGTCILGWLSTW